MIKSSYYGSHTVTNRYKLLALDETRPGMSLSDDLLDAHGNVLLPQGAVLTNAILSSLRRHHIEIIPITSGELTAAEEEAARRRHSERLFRLFRRVGESESSQLLKQYMTDFRMGDVS